MVDVLSCSTGSRGRICSFWMEKSYKTSLNINYIERKALATVTSQEQPINLQVRNHNYYFNCIFSQQTFPL